MKKQLLFLLIAGTVLSLTLSVRTFYGEKNASLFDLNVEALTQNEHYPDKTSPIWVVTYHNSGTSNQSIDCVTGGHYSCPEG